jgi:hypothetical protein
MCICPANRFIMISDRRRLRRWATQLLLVWLFGLATGVANACVRGESVHHRTGSAASADSQKHHRGDEQPDPAKATCLDFCEKSSIAALQLKVGDDGLAAFGLVLPVSNTCTLRNLGGAGVGQLAVDSPHLPGGPPPRIAFLRLTL